MAIKVPDGWTVLQRLTVQGRYLVKQIVTIDEPAAGDACEIVVFGDAIPTGIDADAGKAEPTHLWDKRAIWRVSAQHSRNVAHTTLAHPGGATVNIYCEAATPPRLRSAMTIMETLRRRVD